MMPFVMHYCIKEVGYFTYCIMLPSSVLKDLFQQVIKCKYDRADTISNLTKKDGERFLMCGSSWHMAVHKCLVLSDFPVHWSWADFGRFHRCYPSKGMGPFLKSTAQEHRHLAKTVWGWYVSYLLVILTPQSAIQLQLLIWIVGLCGRGRFLESCR